MAITVDRTFLGNGWSFPPSFGAERGHVAMVAEEADIEQSLHLLMSTDPGERVMHPSFGCGLRRMVFGHIEQSAVTEIQDLVTQAVLFFEPRITLDAVQVDRSAQDTGLLRIRLDYTVRTTNARANMVFPLYITEGAGSPSTLHATGSP